VCNRRMSNKIGDRMKKRFYNIKSVAKAAVEAHKKGKPLNPAGIKAFGLSFNYQDTEAIYKGVAPVIGTRIMTTGAQGLVAGINKVLDEGGEVDGINAFRVRGSFQLPVKRGTKDATEKQESQAESVDTLSVEGSNGSDDVTEKSESESTNSSTSEAEKIEVVEATREVASEVPVADEVETLSKDSKSESSQSGQIDWGHAESLTKKELDKYARTFGVDLDGRKSKAKMLDDLKVALSDEG